MLMALTNFMRLSLRRAAHAALSSAAWQEIRVRFGRDDNITSVTPLFPAVELNLIACLRGSGTATAHRPNV